MILITGATGFIGKRLADLLVNFAESDISVFLRAEKDASRLPVNVACQIIPGDLQSPRSLLKATEGVSTIYHLAGTDNRGRHSNLEDVDIIGIDNLLEAAIENHVGRIIFLSRVGAGKQSANTLLNAKGIIEDKIIKSGIAYTIVRASIVFGETDHFSENIAMMNSSFPIFSVPGDGEITLQPIWVEDLIACLYLMLEDHRLVDQIIELGGPEVLSLRRVIMRTMYAMEKQRPIISLPLLLHRWIAWYYDGLFARWPYTENLVELLTSNQTADLGLVERLFGFRPAAYDISVLRSYMKGRHYFLNLLDYATDTSWGKQ